ncbi:MAG: DNA-binding protein [Helicobacteraceae bacterium]|nr:DNA-binding protein [Candidatus Sulfurimonas ponti]
MASMTILEAAEHLGVSKEAIHNRVRRGSLDVSVIDGVKYVDVDATAKAPAAKAKPQTRRASTKATDERYYKFLEEQNSQLQTKVEKLEGETRTLRDQKELMLIQEREKIEQIYKDKDEQLKNFLSTLSSQFMLNAPSQAVEAEEEHLDAEIEVNLDDSDEISEAAELNEAQELQPKKKLISLKKYMKKHGFSDKKKEKVTERFAKKAKKDERIIVLGSKFYIDTQKYTYSDLIR